MDWSNAFVRRVSNIDHPPDTWELHLNRTGSPKSTSKKIRWLSLSPPPITAILLSYDYLILKKKIDEDDALEPFINPVTEFREDAFVEVGLGEVPRGAIVQFERRGYYMLDKTIRGISLVSGGEGGKVLEFIEIPDGTSASVTPKGPHLRRADRESAQENVLVAL
jgi:glutamyl-tRNA synthetase